MTAKSYDFIIVGAGAAGLSLACHLVGSWAVSRRDFGSDSGSLRDCSILLVDRSLRERADRTWAFWSKPALVRSEGAGCAPGTLLPIEGVGSHSWHRLLVAAPGRTLALRIHPYSYRAIRGADFYHHAHERLSAFPEVELVEGRVDAIEDGVESASICVGGQKYVGRWVFDSRFRLAGFHPDRGYHYLKMQFRGWDIEAREASFDPRTATFLDFRTPQRGQFRFLYMLPYDRHRALVEHVACVPASSKLLHAEEEEQSLKEYVRGTLAVTDYTVTRQERGVNPMTDYPFPRRPGRRIMNIGIPGGMLKPTTGFAFTRIQRDSEAIVRSLLDAGHPFNVPASPWVYRLYESLMLGFMERHGGRVGSLLAAFFRLGSAPHILRFLDEQGVPL